MFSVFYINLDRHTERRRFIENEIATTGLATERVAGCDGRNLDLPEFAAPFFAAASHLTDTQIACSTSHLSVMRLIADRNLPHALIVEDDARLPADLGATVDEVLTKLPEGWDLVRLCRAPKRAVKPLADLADGRRLVRYSRVPVGRAGYLVSNSGARKLLRPRSITRPGDVEIAHPWLLDLDVYGVDPPPIIQERTALPSSIGNKRGDIERSQRSRPDLARVAFNIRKLGPAWWTRCLVANTVGKLR